MRIEIECEEGDFSTIIDWPELAAWGLAPNSTSLNDPGLDALLLHHWATKPKIGGQEGLASGHSPYRFKAVGEAEFRTDKKMVVSGSYATILKR